ncbi:MAG: sulfatase-like hydrolase/transferase, partial [Thermoleophilaceae bacterium]
MDAAASNPPAPRGESEATREQPGPGRRFLHLAVLAAFCFAEPALLAANATLYAGYGSAPLDVFVAATLLVVLPPAILLGLEELAGLAGHDWRERLHLVFVGGLAALGASTLLFASGTIARLLGALIGGAAFAYGYRRYDWLRTALTVLSPLPLVFLLLYLFVSPVSGFTLSNQDGIRIEDVPGRAPVVMIVLDELAVTSLMEGRERIDARRYPNFARLARGSDWFRNATTVHWETHRAVPALVSARRSGEDDIPFVVDHPHNLFTLLGGSYDVAAEEPYARLCPESVCHAIGERSFGERLTSLIGNLTLVSAVVSVPDGVRNRLSIPGPREAEEGDPTEEVDRFLAELGRPAHGGRPQLDYMHLLLPHVPWERMPSGKRYPTEDETLVGLQGTEKWTDDRQRIRENHQRYLLQLAYTDRVLGRVLDKLRATGAYDRSLIVLTADHGVSFKPDDQRREINSANAEDIFPVPLFVKRPGQGRGRVLDRHVETIDIVPTIADALGI